MKSSASKKISRLFLLAALLLSVQGRAQYFSMGADPGAIKWSRIQVHQFSLLFPSGFIKLPDDYSRVLNTVLNPVTASMQSTIRRFPAIIHPFASYSNGGSILAPRRIEFFPKQPISLETNDFTSQLIIHEVRHIAQMERLNTGFTRVAGYLLGDQAQSLVLGIHVPKWLLEGDAVLTETLLSNGGRGRIANFIQPLRSRLVDNLDVSWDRVLFGSYRELLPNEYLYGYFLTARGRMLADPMLWSDALGQIGRNPFNINGLSGLTRPKTGFRFSKLYVETMAWLRDYWTDPAMAVKSPEGMITLTPVDDQYQNYFRPQVFSNQEVICLKKTLFDLPAFVIIDSAAQERIVARPGTIEDAGFSYRQGKLAWTEMVQDPRWENRSWSELFVYDFISGKKARLTHGKRYFSPVFNDSGSRIAVIEEQPDGTSWIQILDPVDGSVTASMPEARNDHFSYICWGLTDDEIFAVTTGADGRKLIRVDYREKQQEIILDAGFADICTPAVMGEWIYFAAPAGATQGLYRISGKSGALELVFGHPHGVNYLNICDGQLYLSVYSGLGYRPARIDLTPLKGKRVNKVYPLMEPVTSIIQRASGEFPLTRSDTVQNFARNPYRKWSHLFRLHSWSPVFVNPDSYQISPGAVLMSQNDLSTLTCWAGYQYIKTDRSQNLVASARYTGFYPVLELDYSWKFRDAEPESDTIPGFPPAYRQYLRFGSGIPLNFSTGSWSRRIQPTIFLELSNYLADRESVYNRSAWMAGFSLSASSVRKMSYRDLFPRWGLATYLTYFKAISHSKAGDNLLGRLMVYMPGFLPNSSLRILNSVRLLTFDPFFNSSQDFPRGQIMYSGLRRYNLKIDYAFPIAYPDYHISWLLYVKRIKTNLFFDAGTGLDVKDWFTTAGLDLTFDYHVLRTGIALESGLRLMYFPTTGKMGAEILFGFSIN